jgi:hypothetical protein
LGIHFRRGSNLPGGTTSQKTVAKNALGENIIVSDNSNQYFQQLAKTWEAFPRPSIVLPPQQSSSPIIVRSAPAWPIKINQRRGSNRLVEVEIPALAL